MDPTDIMIVAQKYSVRQKQKYFDYKKTDRLLKENYVTAEIISYT